MSADRATVAHLLRRAGFGPTAAEVDAATAAGYDATVDALLDFSGPDPADAAAPPTFTPVDTTAEWWLTRMATTAHPLREKLTLYWHGHFATSIAKVRRADLMYAQNQTFRSLGSGGFEALTQAVAKDPAMMIWLDTRADRAGHPNENFARELMELFTLGIGTYTEADVREAARAFTGWPLERRQHDTGQKTFLGHTGNLTGEDIIHIVTTDQRGQAFVAARLWSHFAYPITPSDPVVRDLRSPDIAALLRAMFLHPQFVSPQARTGLVRQPIEWVVGSARALGVHPRRLTPVLTALGQVPFRPPNVAGWPQNGYWLSTATSLARFEFATALAKLAPSPPTTADAAAHLLSTTWSDTTATALQDAAGDPKLLLALALVAPESVLA